MKNSISRRSFLKKSLAAANASLLIGLVTAPANSGEECLVWRKMEGESCGGCVPTYEGAEASGRAQAIANASAVDVERNEEPCTWRNGGNNPDMFPADGPIVSVSVSYCEDSEGYCWESWASWLNIYCDNYR